MHGSNSVSMLNKRQSQPQLQKQRANMQEGPSFSKQHSTLQLSARLALASYRSISRKSWCESVSRTLYRSAPCVAHAQCASFNRRISPRDVVMAIGRSLSMSALINDGLLSPGEKLLTFDYMVRRLPSC